MRECKEFKNAVNELLSYYKINKDLSFENLESNLSLISMYIENPSELQYSKIYNNVESLFSYDLIIYYFKDIENTSLKLLKIYYKFFNFFYTNNSYIICKKLNCLQFYEKVIDVYSKEDIKELLYNGILRFVDLKNDFTLTKEHTIRVNKNKKIWKSILGDLINTDYILS